MSTKLAFKNKCYYFYNYLINLSNFSMNNLKLDKKKHGKTLIFIILAMLIKISLRIGVLIV